MANKKRKRGEQVDQWKFFKQLINENKAVCLLCHDKDDISDIKAKIQRSARRFGTI
jgi:hypothetical protein